VFKKNKIFQSYSLKKKSKIEKGNFDFQKHIAQSKRLSLHLKIKDLCFQE